MLDTIKCMDYDGMGNCGRFPPTKNKNRITFWRMLVSFIKKIK
jgi:hypothetical protein